MADLTDLLGDSSSERFSDLVSRTVKGVLSSLNWVPSDRSPGVHCSEMYKFCPRRKMFEELDPIDGAKDVDALTMARFNLGTALHDLYQNQYLGPSGILLGRWECKRCGFTVGGTDRDSWLPMPSGPCEKCLETAKCECIWSDDCSVEKHCQLCPLGGFWRYVELPVRDEETGYVGHTDGILNTDPLSLLELKSAGPRSYRYLKKPYDSHVLQASLYMRPLGLDQARIVYIDKANEDDNIVKEFVVDYDEAAVERALALVRSYNAAREAKEFPPRILGCDTRNCPWASRCFDDDYVDALIEEWRNGPKG